MASERITVPELPKGIEIQGIERVSPAARTHARIFDNFTLWLSANLVISTVALGTLAIPIFGLGFWDSVVAIILFNILGVLPVAFFSTLGSKLGLRQMTISRFSFGWTGSIIMALFNVASCIGWSTVAALVGGQLIEALSNGIIPRWVGILIIAVLTTMISIYGYAYIHKYERYAWVPMVIIFAIMLIIAGPDFHVIPTPAFSIIEIASFISFGGAIFGFAVGWSSYAADYTVNQPEETPSDHIFWLTFLGIIIPCILLEVFGLALITVAAYHGKEGGDLLAAVVKPLGKGGTLLLVLLALSTVANNIPNDYSLGLSMQVLGKPFQRVNRTIWTLMGAVVYVIIALFAAKYFDIALENFLLLISYWLGPWIIILVLEHFIFRHGRYNVDDWNVPTKLPLGWAAMISLLLGLVGAYLGADQAYFLGPLAKLVGPNGVDIGFELGIVFSGVSYLFLRHLELSINKR